MGKLIAAALAMVVFVFVMAAIMAVPTMLLWNWIVPDITRNALTSLTFWQAFGLNFLTAILFKSSNKND